MKNAATSHVPDLTQSHTRARLPSSPQSGTRPAATADPALVVDLPNVLAYTFENLFLMLWRGPTTDAALDAIHLAMQALVDGRSDGIAIFSIIERGATPPSAEHRERVRLFQEQLDHRVLGLALLIDGMGFWASAVLGVATAITSARRVRFRQRVCRSQDEAVQFIAAEAQGTPAGIAAAVARAVDYARTDSALRRSR